MSTVSYVLNDGPRKVRPELKEKVLAAVKELDYRPSRIARSMVTRRSGALGVIHETMRYQSRGATFVQTVMNGIAAEAQRNRFDLLLYTNALTDHPERALTDVLDGRSDGIIVIAPLATDSLIDELAERSVPMISVAGYHRPTVPYIQGDNVHGIEAAMQHLVSLGHRKIGTIYGDLDSHDGRERYDAYLGFLNAHGLKVNQSWIRGGHFDGVQASNWAMEILSVSNRPTAILAANDEMAAAALTVAQSLSIKVPEELSIVGYDDTILGLLSKPALTSVAQPLETMGATAVQSMIDLIEGRDVPNVKMFPTDLVIRDSTAPPSR